MLRVVILEKPVNAGRGFGHRLRRWRLVRFERLRHARPKAGDFTHSRTKPNLKANLHLEAQVSCPVFHRLDSVEFVEGLGFCTIDIDINVHESLVMHPVVRAIDKAFYPVNMVLEIIRVSDDHDNPISRDSRFPFHTVEAVLVLLVEDGHPIPIGS